MFDDADAIEDGVTTDKACEKNTLGVVHKSPTQRDIHLKIKRCCKSGEDMMLGNINQVCNSLLRESTVLLDLRLIQQDVLWQYASFKRYWENTHILKLQYSTRILQYQAIGRRWPFSIFGTE